ncbi:MAG: hypothetical protein NT157_07020 [Candidatus Micrarchaeota archaeon]|nr:hypothetical protein [Candidatus Micrarchaeota archaeon]
MEAKWKLEFKPGWDEYFKDFDKSVQQRILKKFEQMKLLLKGRGLHSSKYMVEETGGYRIAYIEDKAAGAKRIHFVGNHKQYVRWYGGKSE